MRTLVVSKPGELVVPIAGLVIPFSSAYAIPIGLSKSTLLKDVHASLGVVGFVVNPNELVAPYGVDVMSSLTRFGCAWDWSGFHVVYLELQQPHGEVDLSLPNNTLCTADGSVTYVGWSKNRPVFQVGDVHLARFGGKEGTSSYFSPRASDLVWLPVTGHPLLLIECVANPKAFYEEAWSV